MNIFIRYLKIINRILFTYYEEPMIASIISESVMSAFHIINRSEHNALKFLSFTECSI